MPLRLFGKDRRQRATASPTQVQADLASWTVEGLMAAGAQSAKFLPKHRVSLGQPVAAWRRGTHGRRQAGSGDSFWQYRPFDSQDPATMIDWRRSAKSDKLYVRQNENEAPHSVFFWCDASGSMAYRSKEEWPAKRDRALVLTMALATHLADVGERVGGLVPAASGQMIRASAGRFGLAQLAERLLDTAPGSSQGSGQGSAFTNPAECAPIPARSHVVLVGDFFDPPERLGPDRRGPLSRLNGGRGLVLQVLDPAEIDFPYAGRATFFGLERDGAHLLNRAEDVRSEYQARLDARQADWTHWAQRRGWVFLRHRVDQAVGPCLLSAMAGLRG